MSPQSFYDHSFKIYNDAEAAKQYRLNRFVGGPGGERGKPITPDA